MLCYFDDCNKVNLSYIEQINNVRSMHELRENLSRSNFTPVYSNSYDSLGIYLIEVSKIPSLWCAKTSEPSSNILLDIRSSVISAVKNKKLRTPFLQSKIIG
jgi:hypothetical protein